MNGSKPLCEGSNTPGHNYTLIPGSNIGSAAYCNICKGRYPVYWSSKGIRTDTLMWLIQAHHVPVFLKDNPWIYTEESNEPI